jgi:hypothetical protein
VAKVFVGNVPRLGKAGRDKADDVVAAILVMNRTLHTNDVVPRIKAMYHAAEQRMRPMLMTALSACIGLLPAAISTGIGSQVQRPLATVVVGGMLIGPVIMLVVVPVIGGLKAQLVGEIEVAGPDLARSLTDLGLIDEYRLYFRPVVLGGGKPFFAGTRPPLRLVASDPIGEDAIRLTYVPA